MLSKNHFLADLYTPRPAGAPTDRVNAAKFELRANGEHDIYCVVAAAFVATIAQLGARSVAICNTCTWEIFELLPLYLPMISEKFSSVQQQ